MDRRDIVRQRLHRKLVTSGKIGCSDNCDHDHSCSDNCDHDHSCSDNCNHETDPKEIVFDITPSNLRHLSDAIKHCINNNLIFKPYSSLTFKYPKISLTQIPDLPALFQKACIHHGLLGYLDWANENYPSESINIAINNIIIITSGVVASNPETGDIVLDEHGNIAHNINNSKLEIIRKISREKFLALVEN